jgi:organic radical activating enzyme
MSKIYLQQAHWYITHTCNLTCQSCYSFNNFAISGHERWEDNEPFVAKWSELVHIEGFGILGGEPMGNPDCDKWVKGLRKYFPDTVDFKLFTNGTYLNKWKEQIKEWIDLKVTIAVHVHDIDEYDNIMACVKDILNDINYTTEKTGLDYPDYFDDYEEIVFVDGFPAFLLQKDVTFFKWGPTLKDDAFQFNNADPEVIHSHCSVCLKPCPYFYKGHMYKCGPIVGSSEFVKKYKVNDRAKELLLSYKPLSPYDEDLNIKVPSLVANHTAQCSLCPVYVNTDLTGLTPLSPKKRPVDF